MAICCKFIGLRLFPKQFNNNSLPVSLFLHSNFTTTAFGIATIVLGVENSNLKEKIKDLEKQLQSVTGSNNMSKYKLPDTVKPALYDLYLYPNLTTGLFKGKVNIALTVLVETESVVLHSKNLTIDSVKIGDETGSFTLDPEYELLTIKRVDNSQLSVGNTTVEIEFNGDMKNRIVGLYTSSYKGANGENSFFTKCRERVSHIREEMLKDNLPGTTPRLPTCVNLPVQDDLLKDLVEKAKDWAVMHGAAMRSKTDFNPDVVQFAPFVLFPSVLKTEDFHKLTSIQLVFNELIHKVAHNREFLKNCLSDTILVDEFTRNMFNIYETVEGDGVVQPLSLGLLRCDWMLKSDEVRNLSEKQAHSGWKQVEINTIAAGFGWLGPASKAIHEYVFQELNQHDKLKHLPENNALTGLCEGMLDAWKLYENPEAVILFIVEETSFNICDQRFHEYEIRKLNPKAKVIRRTLTEVGNTAFLSREKSLVVDDFEVAVIYFRAGYHPDHYHGVKEWNARLLMEKSKAIKCPTIQYHLAGTKKIQQELAKPGALEKFLDRNVAEVIQEFFVGQYGLDFDELGNTAVEMALEEPDRFVLKPQREGGGNNIYGVEVREAMLKMKNSKERTAWIVMERIRPPITKGYMIRPGGPNPPPLNEMVSELGIFGVIIGDRSHVIINRQVGHMLRTKMSTANEGGVAAGHGALDSPFLID